MSLKELYPDFDSFELSKENEGEFVLRGYGTYPRSSVLEGQPRVAVLDFFNDQKTAEAETGLAVCDAPSLPPVASMPECAPEWFDPEDAGECWHEDDY